MLLSYQAESFTPKLVEYHDDFGFLRTRKEPCRVRESDFPGPRAWKSAKHQQAIQAGMLIGAACCRTDDSSHLHPATC